MDKFLAEHSLLSRSAIQRLAREGHVLVDGSAVEPSHKVRAGQELVVDVPAAEPDAVLRAEDIAVDVLYEDDDVVVVSKPAGLVVHPAYGHKTGTLVNAMLGRIASRTGRESGRPGIVHRLDKDTSGVMVIAKTDTAQLALSRQLQGQRFQKEYLALVWGDPGDTDTVVEAPLQRDAEDRRRMVVRAGGREATTKFRRIAAWGSGNARVSLLHVRPVTGRTHQLRVHCAAMGFPIFGDDIYGNEASQRRARQIKFVARPDAPGLQLHAREVLVPISKNKEPVRVIAPVPPHLRARLAACGWNGDDA